MEFTNDKVIEILKAGILTVRQLMNSSDGVYGLHLNGDNSPWEDLQTGGRYQEWLAEFDTAVEASIATNVNRPLEEVAFWLFDEAECTLETLNSTMVKTYHGDRWAVADPYGNWLATGKTMEEAIRKGAAAAEQGGTTENSFV